ncbi:DUF1566 domain-containing protein [uncultured Paraglaciecola sp.]|uniref:Lcl C-terminal domain-containing protein n=1 Tax=uncultured Paraglaciecola sp. TaxID=1765024 RepID=UPI0030DD9569
MRKISHYTIHYWLSLFFATMVLTACGGSGSSDSSTDNTPKVLVNAGPGSTVNEGTTVNLQGDAVGTTDELTYAWSAAPTLDITHDDTTSGVASFVAPTTSDSQTYRLTLQATDGNGNVGSDTLDITVLPLNTKPNALITYQPIDGFSNNVFPAGMNVTLDGSTSTDADAADASDPIAAYQWQQLAGVDVLSGVSKDANSISFTTPILDEDTSLTFELTVTDYEGGTDSQELTVTILSARNNVPTVDAGVDHQVFSGESILLSGIADTAIPSAKPLTYLWLKDSLLEPQINNANVLQTFAVAPMVSSAQVLTFTLQVTDANNNEVDDSISVTVKPFPRSLINDTGVTRQGSTNAINSSHQADYPAQDGQRGRDIIANNNMLTKAGRGEGGFDFTRLDNIGDEVDDVSQPWRCVRDNVTGLVWEIKTTTGDLHGRRHTYSWYDEENNGGYSGPLNPDVPSCSISNCNTQAFVEEVNAQGLCGFYDWKLPDHNELLSVVHFGKSTSPLLDTDYFPYADDGSTSTLWYWTSQASVDGTNEEAQNAWAIDFSSGNDNFLNKSTAVNVRLVRAGR